MKTLIKILMLSIVLYSCDSDESLDIVDHIDDKLVEEYTYDPYGVIFKITNDLDHIEGVSQNESFDSLVFCKFHYELNSETVSNDVHNIEYFTWIPYGHYVYWRYNYTGDKQVIITSFNENNQFIYAFIKKYSCKPDDIDTDWFQYIFPYPINDTVYVSMAKIIEDIITTK